MDVCLRPQPIKSDLTLQLTGSKSETNRLLLLQALFPQIQIENASESDDSRVMRQALEITQGVVDVHHAGTAMRFLTAFFATMPGCEIDLTGSDRMQQRPIGILVEALRELGADIRYINKNGFPPLRIHGKNLGAGHVAMRGDISSQYLSALLLVAPRLRNGIELQLLGPVTSLPYLKMTLALLDQVGVETHFTANTVLVRPVSPNFTPVKTNFTVESDWSSASYWYSLMALSTIGSSIRLATFKQDSLQGDAALVSIYRQLGVETQFDGNGMVLTKKPMDIPSIGLQLSDNPDIAQTIAVTCLGFGIPCELKGLHTLVIKETDRLSAMKTELEKFGATVSITHDTLAMEPPQSLPENIVVATYNDHRMAMAFAPLALKIPLHIQDAGVVSKSYPAFWTDLEQLGIGTTFSG